MNKKTTALLIVQFAAVVASGIIAKDGIYAIIVSVIGLVFNFLVSLNIPYGFIFGFAYAITNGILAFRTGAYATFAFMIFLQAPMAIYSFFKWKRRKSGGEEIMKKMTPAWIIGLCVFMALLGVGSYFALGKLGGSAVITDTIFFVFSVTACLLLAGCFKNAYILTLLSGLALALSADKSGRRALGRGILYNRVDKLGYRCVSAVFFEEVPQGIKQHMKKAADKAAFLLYYFIAISSPRLSSSTVFGA